MLKYFIKAQRQDQVKIKVQQHICSLFPEILRSDFVSIPGFTLINSPGLWLTQSMSLTQDYEGP